jgi:serine acetyltransferase
MIRRFTSLAIAILLVLLPWRLRAVVYRHIFGWHIARTARVGFSLFLHVQQVTLGDGARIGHLNVFRSLRSVDIASEAEVGSLNWFTSSPKLMKEDPDGIAASLVLGTHSAITSRHYVDCPGGVHVGAFTTVAGVRSTILSHQIDIRQSKQTVSPVIIGDYCMIGSNSCLLPGAKIPDQTVVALGSVVHGRLEKSRFLYAGVPARPVHAVEGAYFDRLTGRVD